MSLANKIVLFSSILLTTTALTVVVYKKTLNGVEKPKIDKQDQEDEPKFSKLKNIPKDEPVPEKIQLPEFKDWPRISLREKEDSKYADLINHTKHPVLEYDRSTNAHETTHMINSDIRNSLETGGFNAFYVFNNKAIVVKEPNIKKSQVADFVPKGLRFYRFGTYINGMNAWNDTPLYLADEWTAYINGAEVSIEDVQKLKHRTDWTDAVSGCLEFSIYATALAMAIEVHDPEYLKNKQFIDFMKFNLRRSMNCYKIGCKMKEFSWESQDRLLSDLLTSNEAANMRNCLKSHFDSIWLNEKFEVIEHSSPKKIMIMEGPTRMWAVEVK